MSAFSHFYSTSIPTPIPTSIPTPIPISIPIPIPTAIPIPIPTPIPIPIPTPILIPIPTPIPIPILTNISPYTTIRILLASAAVNTANYVLHVTFKSKLDETQPVN